jgi:hypothetical protein
VDILARKVSPAAPNLGELKSGRNFSRSNVTPGGISFRLPQDWGRGASNPKVTAPEGVFTLPPLELLKAPEPVAKLDESDAVEKRETLCRR